MLHSDQMQMQRFLALRCSCKICGRNIAGLEWVRQIYSAVDATTLHVISVLWCECTMRLEALPRSTGMKIHFPVTNTLRDQRSGVETHSEQWSGRCPPTGLWFICVCVCMFAQVLPAGLSDGPGQSEQTDERIKEELQTGTSDIFTVTSFLVYGTIISLPLDFPWVSVWPRANERHGVSVFCIQHSRHLQDFLKKNKFWQSKVATDKLFCFKWSSSWLHCVMALEQWHRLNH